MALLIHNHTLCCVASIFAFFHSATMGKTGVRDLGIPLDISMAHGVTVLQILADAHDVLAAGYAGAIG